MYKLYFICIVLVYVNCCNVKRTLMHGMQHINWYKTALHEVNKAFNIIYMIQYIL